VGAGREGGGALIWVEELVWKHESGVWNLVPLCLMWKIWKERNSRIFEDKASSMDQLKGAFVNALFDWARVSGFTTTILVTEVVDSVYALLLRLLVLCNFYFLNVHSLCTYRFFSSLIKLFCL
jgi:hypothetical protein